MNIARWHGRATLATALTALVVSAVAMRSTGGAAAFPVLAIPATIGAWWARGTAFGREVPRFLVNIVLCLAVGWTLLRATRGVSVDDVTELLIALIVIKAFDRHTARDYGQMLTVSVFLALGSILTSVEFVVGMTLAPFLPLLTGAVMLHQMQSGREWAQADGRSAAARPGPGAAGQFRWLTAVVSLLVVLEASVFFVMMPRGLGANMLGDWGRAVAGAEVRFTPTIELGRGGFTSQSSEIVMHLALRDPRGQAYGGPDMVHYLRGNVLDRYEEGRWTRSPEAQASDSRHTVDATGEGLPFGFGEGQLVEQRVTILSAPEGEAYIFTKLRPVQVLFGRDQVVRINAGDGRIVAEGASGELAYTVWSLDREPPADESDRPAPASFPSRAVRAIAEQVLADEGVSPDPAARDAAGDTRAAMAIQNYLRTQFRYTLDVLEAPEDRDPIEWFLTDAREGHCEYFASAMAAMCRSVGLPARVIAGYAATEWIGASQHYVIRESNAHAWVEVQHGRLRWRTYDPTPPGDFARIHAPPQGLFSLARRLFDAMDHLWVRSIVSFDEGTRERIASFEAGRGTSWIGSLVSVADRLRAGGPGLLGRSLLAGASVFGLVFAMGLGVRALLASGRGRRGRAARVAAPGLPARSAPARFYAALLDTLDRRGLSKPAWRPPLDHASSLRPVSGDAADAVERVAGLYYRARFRGDAISPAEAAEAARLTAELARIPISRPGG